MKTLREPFTKRQFFVLFNLITLVYVLLSESKFEAEFFLALFISFGIINGIILHSTRKYPDWKWNQKEKSSISAQR